MASHNGAPWIRQQIDSILSQDRVDVTLHVFDDCSSDDTELQIRAISKQNSQIKIHKFDHPSGSAGLAFMQAFAMIDTHGFDFVALADQDDIWSQSKLIRAAEQLSAAPRAAGYSCSVIAFWSDGKTKLIRQNSAVRPLDYLFEGAGQGCTFVIRESFFSAIQPLFITHERLFKTFHYHDWLLYLIARAHGHDWVFDDIPCIYYRQHEKNELGARGTRIALTKRLNLIRNGWYRHQVTTAIQITNIFMPKDENAHVFSFNHLYSRSNSIFRRLRLARNVLLYSRRKFIERVVVSICSLAGWL